MDDVVRAVEGLVEVVKNNVEQKRYVRNVLDKVCSVLLVRFTNALVRSRPLREVGGEQVRFCISWGVKDGSSNFSIAVNRSWEPKSLFKQAAWGSFDDWILYQNVDQDDDAVRSSAKSYRNPCGEYFLHSLSLTPEDFVGSSGRLHPQLYPPHRRCVLYEFPKDPRSKGDAQICAKWSFGLFPHAYEYQDGFGEHVVPFVARYGPAIDWPWSWRELGLPWCREEWKCARIWRVRR